MDEFDQLRVRFKLAEEDALRKLLATEDNTIGVRFTYAWRRYWTTVTYKINRKGQRTGEYKESFFSDTRVTGMYDPPDVKSGIWKLKHPSWTAGGDVITAYDWMTIPYVNNKKNGTAILKNQLGDVYETAEWKNGKLDGLVWGGTNISPQVAVWWGLEGQSYNYYKDGKREGVQLGYYSDGRLAYLAIYKNGKPHGKSVDYWEGTGKPKRKQEHIEGDLVGYLKEFDADGTKTIATVGERFLSPAGGTFARRLCFSKWRVEQEKGITAFLHAVESKLPKVEQKEDGAFLMTKPTHERVGLEHLTHHPLYAHNDMLALISAYLKGPEDFKGA